MDEEGSPTCIEPGGREREERPPDIRGEIVTMFSIVKDRGRVE
jgi:hypothetical protein